VPCASSLDRSSCDLSVCHGEYAESVPIRPPAPGIDKDGRMNELQECRGVRRGGAGAERAVIATFSEEGKFVAWNVICVITGRMGECVGCKQRKLAVTFP
jgi:hypothetical protein